MHSVHDKTNQRTVSKNERKNLPVQVIVNRIGVSHQLTLLNLKYDFYLQKNINCSKITYSEYRACR